MAAAMFLFVLAGLAEIGGGYLDWLWLRESKPIGYGIAGSIVLILYGLYRHYNVSRISDSYMLHTAVFSWCLRCCGDGSSIEKRQISMTGSEQSYALQEFL